MKRLMASVAFVAFAVGAGPAMAQCNIGKTTEYTEKDDAVANEARSDLRKLRNSAMILNNYGKDDACQTVVAAIEDIRDQRGMKQAESGDQDRAMADGEAQAERNKQYKEAMTNARPVTEIDRLTVSQMLDADVRGASGEVVGEISNMVLDESGEPSHAILAFGGFLGLGEDRVAVPYGKLRMHSSLEDQDDMVFFVPMSNEQLENAPRIDTEDDGWLSDENWLSQNEEYYDDNSVAG